MATTLYFAYGSNMDAAQMARRCPDSVPVSCASLEGWRFRINSRGVATIVPESGAVVYGAMWRLSESDLASLNRYEGVAGGVYGIRTIDVRLVDGRRMNALVYVAADDRPGAPRPRYVPRIVAAALAHGFPQDYVEEIRRWSARRG